MCSLPARTESSNCSRVMFDSTTSGARIVAPLDRQVALELALEKLNLRAGELVERLEVFVAGDARVGDDENAMLHVVERQHRVEQHEPGVVGAIGARARGRRAPARTRRRRHIRDSRRLRL